DLDARQADAFDLKLRAELERDHLNAAVGETKGVGALVRGVESLQHVVGSCHRRVIRRSNRVLLPDITHLYPPVEEEMATAVAEIVRCLALELCENAGCERGGFCFKG